MDVLPIRILPATPDYVMSEVEVRAYYESMRKAPERAVQPKRVNEQCEELDENGEVVRYCLDPPCYYELHYTEVARHDSYAKEWSWPLMVAAMPRLLADWHEGKYAVVTADSIAVAVKWSDAQAECQRLGFGSHIRLYQIRERITFGRKHSRMRRLSNKPHVPPEPVDEAIVKQFIDAVLAHRRKELRGHSPNRQGGMTEWPIHPRSAG